MGGLSSLSSEPDHYHRLSINFKAQMRCLLGYVFPFIAFPPLSLILLQLEKLARYECCKFLQLEFLGLPAAAIAALCFLFCAGLFHYFWFSYRPVYLLDFACFRPRGGGWALAMHDFMRKSKLLARFTEESLDFQKKILQRSGIGHQTYFPRAIMSETPNPCLEEARGEGEDVMFGCLDELFAKSCIKPREIGILVVNCSVFCPLPSLCAMIVNRYKMRGNILSYNLGGMGCSAGVIAVGLAQQLLKVHRRTRALVVSTENITLAWYTGNDRPMLVSNCLFRLGGCAALLSNIPCDKRAAKYVLKHVVRTHRAAEDKSFYCVQQTDDSTGVQGVNLSRELMSVAGSALKTNLTTLGPLVLPIHEQLHFFATLLGRKIFKLSIKPYIPDFKAAFEHFCIHAGGRAVLDEVEKNLMLTEGLMEASRMTLYRFGNTSSSSIWYELAYLEAKGRVRKGDRVWQIGFGSGFKCNSAVWQSLREVKSSNCWSEFIDELPVEVPTMEIF